jgi:hypothetical protein
MPLEERHWVCDCGTHLRYANQHRMEVHYKSKKHMHFLVHKTVFVEQYIQRTRKQDSITIEKL